MAPVSDPPWPGSITTERSRRGPVAADDEREIFAVGAAQSLAMDGSTLVAGGGGAAHFFELVDGRWSASAVVEDTHDQFGRTVDVSGAWAVAADSAEALRDFAVIAQASLDDESTDEELENSYAEIVEYVRIAALNVFMDGHVPDPESDQEADPPQLH